MLPFVFITPTLKGLQKREPCPPVVHFSMFPFTCVHSHVCLMPW